MESANAGPLNEMTSPHRPNPLPRMETGRSPQDAPTRCGRPRTSVAPDEKASYRSSYLSRLFGPYHHWTDDIKVYLESEGRMAKTFPAIHLEVSGDFLTLVRQSLLLLSMTTGGKDSSRIDTSFRQAAGEENKCDTIRAWYSLGRRLL